MSRVGVLVAMLPLALCAADTQSIDIVASAKAKNPQRAKWLVGKLPSKGEVKVVNEACSFPVEIRGAGDYRVWVKYNTTSNKWMNMAVRIDAPGGEPLFYERIDSTHGLPSANPLKGRDCVRPAQAAWHSFAATFERPGVYSFSVGKAEGSFWQQGGNPPFRLEEVWVSDDAAFDPRRPTRKTDANAKKPSVPAGFVAAREIPMTVALNTGIADEKKRFRTAIHQNYPVFPNPWLLIDVGCVAEQNNYGWTNDGGTGLRGAQNLQNGPDWKEMHDKYPMPKKGETFTPVGRKANAEGKYWDEWSVSFDAANENAYKKDLKTVQDTVANAALNKRTDSWGVAWEQAGTYDYGETSVKAFRTWLAATYGTLAALNKAWRTDYKSFDEIVPAKRADIVGPAKLADPFKRAQATANFIDFRDFCSKEYAKIVARRVAAAKTDPEGRTISTQFANLDLNAVEWSGWRPLNDEDLFRIGVKDADRYGYDVYAVDDWVGAEYDLLSALGNDEKRMEVREGSTHTPDPDLAVRTYWTLVGKGIKGFSHFMLQEGNNHAEFPKFGLTNFDQTPRPKLAAYSDAIRAVHQIENVLVEARRTHAAKPVAIYYSRTCNALQERSLGSLFDCGPDNVFRIYELIRGNGYPATFVTDAQIREGRLDKLAALVFADAKYIPTDVLERVEAWVEKGGAVLADYQPGVYDGHGFPSDRLLKFLGVEPIQQKKVDSLAAEKNPFGYSAMSFDVVDADALHKTQFEFFQQWDSTHPIAKALDKFMFSGFGYQQVKATAGETIVMAQNGRPAAVIREHGKGSSLYFAGLLGSIYGGAATTYEWRDAHSDPSPYRFMDAYLAFVGAKKAAASDQPQRVRTKMRFESPLVDARGNAILSMASYNDDEVKPFRVSWALPQGVKAPKRLYALAQGSRRLTPLDCAADGNGGVAFTMPAFRDFAAVLALNDAEPLVSVDFGEARRGAANLVEVKPGEVLTARVKVFNPSPKPLAAGKVTLRLPAGWYYDRETADVPKVAAFGESGELVFRIHAPAHCAATRIRPLNFIYENASVKSMPTAEVVWWKKAE